MAKDVATKDDAAGEVAEYTPIDYATNIDTEWDTLTGEADKLAGADLLSADILDSLRGVPLLVYKVTYRDGIQEKGARYRSDYVSCEALVAPLHALQDAERKGRLKLDSLTVDPGQHVVFNDGSSGIYRQITSYLAARGYITLPDGPETGRKGDSIYDLPRSQWIAGANPATTGISIRFYCSRGVRVSNYDTGEYGEASTRYLA